MTGLFRGDGANGDLAVHNTRITVDVVRISLENAGDLGLDIGVIASVEGVSDRGVVTIDGILHDGSEVKSHVLPVNINTSDLVLLGSLSDVSDIITFLPLPLTITRISYTLLVLDILVVLVL